MASFTTKPLDINKFWEKTPTPLKYLLAISFVVAISYFLISKKLESNKLNELQRVETNIELTYEIVRRFEAYQVIQNDYNEKLSQDMCNLYLLIQDLNNNMTKRLNYVVEKNGTIDKNLIDKLILLNESFESLSKAYQPVEQQTKKNENTFQ